MSASNKQSLGLCRLCRYVSFGLNDTRLFDVSSVSPPFRGDTSDTRPKSIGAGAMNKKLFSGATAQHPSRGHWPQGP